MGGRVGEWAERPKVPAMHSIVGMAAEGGADTAKLKTTLDLKKIVRCHGIVTRA